jgi:hypothetical protein
MTQWTYVELFTDIDGRARFRERSLTLNEGQPPTHLSAVQPSAGIQWRESPVGFRSDFHCTTTPQWVVIVRGVMEIGLHDGTTRRFGPGGYFFSADELPPDTVFDPTIHGHCSRQCGEEPLQTLFVRA